MREHPEDARGRRGSVDARGFCHGHAAHAGQHLLKGLKSYSILGFLVMTMAKYTPKPYSNC